MFESLLEERCSALDARGNQLLEELHLQHKVQLRDGAFTTQALSHGQRKRLALVAAYLEDRPVLVFDEWAADQDPTFKNVFYHEVPTRAARARKIRARDFPRRPLFHLADQLVRMESGQVVSVEGARVAMQSVAS